MLGGVFVGDDSLNRAIGEVRRAGRTAGGGFVIETIPRTGYRLVPEDCPAPAEPAARPAPTGPRLGRRRVLGGFVLAGAAAGVAWWQRPRRDAAVQALLDQAERALRQAEPAADAQGIGFLKEAVAAAPDDAEAWGRLAIALRTSSDYGPPERMAPLLAESEAAAGRALALDRDQPDARVAQLLRTPIFGNWLALERGLKDVLARHPEHLPALDSLSMVLAGAGLVRTHYPLRLKTVQLDPLHAGYNFRSIYAHWMNGELAAADRAGERGLELWPRHFATWVARASLFAYSGRPERTLAMLADTETRPALPPPVLGTLEAVARALAGGSAAARAQAAAVTMAAAERGGPLMAVNGSMNLAALGETGGALDILEAFLAERGPLIVATAWRPGQPLHNDVRRRFTNFLFTPVMAPLWREARFERLLADIGLPDFWRAGGHGPEYLDPAQDPLKGFPSRR